MEEASSVRKRHGQPQSLANSILELSKTSDEIGSALLLTWDKIEQWQQDNEFMVSSYRPVSKSYIRSLESLRYLHNQSVNIYSHLLPTIACIPVAVYLHFIVAPRYSSADYLDTFVFAMFFTGAIFCFGVSAFFHTIGNHSYDVYHSWLLIDLLGILALTAGSFYPGVYYGFYCEPHIFSTYWIMITLAAGGCTTFCGVPKFRSPPYRKVRAFLFASLAMLGVIPMAHAALKFGIVQAQRQMGWWYFVLEGVFFTLGVLIYASRVPERFSPGTFDVWGSSHQVFHVFVLMGVVSHLLGVVKAFDYTHDPLTRRCQRSLML